MKPILFEILKFSLKEKKSDHNKFINLFIFYLEIYITFLY